KHIMKKERICYFNGEYLSESDFGNVKVPVQEIGGQVIFDNIRTFKGKPFKLREHLKRIFWGCRYFGYELDINIDEMEQITLQLLKNSLEPEYIEEGGDYGISYKISTRYDIHNQDPKIFYTYVSAPYPLTNFFKSRAKLFREGINLVTASSQRQIPHQCVDNRAKIPRPWYILAEKEVKVLREKDPNIWPFPIILDLEGNVTETTASNVFMVRDEEVHTSEENILWGVSRQTVLELAEELRIPAKVHKIKLYDLYTADEVFTTRTSACMLPVNSVNGRKIGDSIPGHVTKRLFDAWSLKVGVDIIKQHFKWEKRHIEFEPIIG
ncbi:MAG: aminotransferase class IV, partial [Promethearchaeota archaeon]